MATADRGACRSWCLCWLSPPPIKKEPVEPTIACYLLAAPGLHGSGGGAAACTYSCIVPTEL